MKTMVLRFIPIGSSVVPFWGLPYRILNMNSEKELLRGLWVRFRVLKTL